MAHDTALSRRALLAISAAASAGALVGSPVAAATASGALAADPDAPLLDLCAQWQAHRREFDSADAAYERAEAAAFNKYRSADWADTVRKVHADPDYRDASSRVAGLVGREHHLFQAIGEARATTLRGLMAKARITAGACLEEGGIEEEAAEYNDGVTPQYMALTLVRDLLAIVERGGELDLPISGGDA